MVIHLWTFRNGQGWCESDGFNIHVSTGLGRYCDCTHSSGRRWHLDILKGDSVTSRWESPRDPYPTPSDCDNACCCVGDRCEESCDRCVSRSGQRDYGTIPGSRWIRTRSEVIQGEACWEGYLNLAIHGDGGGRCKGHGGCGDGTSLKKKSGI